MDDPHNYKQSREGGKVGTPADSFGMQEKNHPKLIGGSQSRPTRALMLSIYATRSYFPTASVLLPSND